MGFSDRIPLYKSGCPTHDTEHDTAGEARSTSDSDIEVNAVAGCSEGISAGSGSPWSSGGVSVVDLGFSESVSGLGSGPSFGVASSSLESM